HGSAYGIVAAHRGYLRPVGQWNFEEVTVIGSKIKVELNGTVILETDLGKVKEFMANSPHPGKDRTSGYFGFAGHHDPVEFRNGAIKTLEGLATPRQGYQCSFQASIFTSAGSSSSCLSREMISLATS